MNQITYIACFVFVCFLGFTIFLDEYDHANATETVIRDSQATMLDNDFLESIKENFPAIMTREFVYAFGVHVAKYNNRFDVEEVLSEISDELREYFVNGYNEVILKQQKKVK